MMQTAPFQRRMDKVTYVFGTNSILLFAYFIAKFPDTHIYTYTTVLMMLLLIHRYVTWFIPYWPYLVEFCYVGNFSLLYFINFAP